MVVTERRISAAVVWHVVRKVTGRLSWGVADQAVCSLTNFLLSIYVARSLGTAEFGAFSLAYVTYGLANNANRGLAIEPLLVRFSASNSTAIWRRAAKGSVSTSLLVGIVLGLCAIAAGAVIGGTTGLAFYGLGLVFPVLLLQDSWRYAFFSWGRGYHAFINDTIWLLIQAPLMVFLKTTGHANVFWFILAWGAGAFVGSIVGSLQAKVVPNLLTAKKWVVKHRDLGLRFFMENTGGSASTTLQSYAISYILGISAVGSIRAAGVLMGPLSIMFFGIGMITVPEAARILRKSPRRLPLYSLALSGGLTLLTLAWTVVLLVGLPHGLGNLMLGTIWRSTYHLVLPTAAATVAGSLATGAMVGIHALGKARRSLRATLINSALVLACSLSGAVIAGVVGTLYFGAAAALIGTLITWWQFREAFHEFHGVLTPHSALPQSVEHHGPGGQHYGTEPETTRILRSYSDGNWSGGNGYQRPEGRARLPAAHYPGQGFAGPGYSGNGQSSSGYADNGDGPSRYGNSEYRSETYGPGGHAPSAEPTGVGGGAETAGYRDTGYGGGRFSGAAHNGRANGHPAGPAYQADRSARGNGAYQSSVAPAAQYGRSLSPQAPELGIPQFASPSAVAAANGNTTGTPRPYGRLSIFTLLDSKMAEFDWLAERAAEAVRTTEPDTLVYVIAVVPMAPRQRIIYEIYRDRVAFESHEQQPHIQRFADDRRSCVLTYNVIDLRLKYAKIAAPSVRAAPRDSQSTRGSETTWAAWSPDTRYRDLLPLRRP